MFRTSLLIAAVLALSACNQAHTRQAKVYQSGEKAEHNKLTYSVVDVQIQPRLGDEPNVRIPQSRFFVVQVSVSNSSNQALPVPAMTLVDDTGKTYAELADGTGVQRWLGVVRNVDPAQTESGQILFDAPAAHYKLRLSDETDEDDVFIDIPLNFIHEQMNNTPINTQPDGAPSKK